MLNGIDSEYTDDVPQRKTQLQSINSETTELASNLQESTRDSLELQDAEEDRFDIKDLAVWYIRAAIHLLIGLCKPQFGFVRINNLIFLQFC